MQARGPLMTEHRLIEKMLAVIQGLLELAPQTQAIAPDRIDAVVDFFRVYADRLHHGKEEDILFKYLQQKRLSAEDGRLMRELVEEHVVGRTTVKALAEANLRYHKGEQAQLAELTARLTTVVNLYPRHIGKEDKVFFPAVQGYLSKEEDQALIDQFWDFDRKMIHEKYKAVIESLGGA